LSANEFAPPRELDQLLGIRWLAGSAEWRLAGPAEQVGTDIAKVGFGATADEKPDRLPWIR